MRNYLLQTWLIEEFRGFRELADVRRLEAGDLPFAEIMKLSQVAAKTIVTARASLVALVVKSPEQGKQAEFFRAARNVLRSSTGEIRIFFSLKEAEKWLMGTKAEAAEGEAEPSATSHS